VKTLAHVVSATVLQPLHRVSAHGARTVVTVLAEHQAVQLSRFRRVRIRHQVPVAVERRLDRGVAELRLDVLRVRPPGDQEARVRLADFGICERCNFDLV
jgi:hypothetical protein